MKSNAPFKLAIAIAIALPLGLTGCQTEAPTSKSSLAQKKFRIVGGQPESGFAAVGALTEGGEAFCTGTLVTTTTVVTAAHCVPGNPNPASIKFFVGHDATQPGSGTALAVKSIHAHPQYDDENITNDIAVLRLAEPAPVTPIAALTTPMDASWKGREATFVGYGVTKGDKDDAGKKRSVTIALSDIQATTIRYEHASKNTCFGDSGGPALAKVGSEFKLIGVTSWGDNDCAAFGVNTRVDTYMDFIKSVDSAAGNASTPAGANEQGQTGDVCELNGWYGDGICDTDCGKPDSDCEGLDMSEAPNPQDDEDYCAANGWYGDGICDVGCPQEDTVDCEGFDLDLDSDLEDSGQSGLDAGDEYPSDDFGQSGDEDCDDGHDDDWGGTDPGYGDEDYGDEDYGDEDYGDEDYGDEDYGDEDWDCDDCE